MDKLKAMRMFAAVVSEGSYVEAGRRLGMARSSISKAVTELETMLGARLLDRTTRSVHPTEAGLAYYERCIDILARVEETERQVSHLHEEPKGLLKLNAPMSFGSLHLGDAIVDFMEAYPDLRIEMRLNDRFVDPIEEGFDVTIRIAELRDSSLIARKLAPARRVLVAAPDYLSKYAEPQRPEDLSGHRCLNFGHTAPTLKWALVSNGRTVMAPISSVLCSNNGDVLRLAAIGGQGITLLPTFIVGADIIAGRLAVVLPTFPPTDLDVFALYAPHKHLAAKVRVFIDFLVERFGPQPQWDRFER